jgi:hypothetical protein
MAEGDALSTTAKWFAGLGAAVLAAVLGAWAIGGSNWVHDQIWPPPVLNIHHEAKTLGSACDDQDGWVFPGPPSHLPQMPMPKSNPVPGQINPIDQWVQNYGGVPASGDYYELTLSALTSKAVTITDITIQVSKSMSPVSGVYPKPETGGCGGFTPNAFVANLDTTPPTVTATNGGGVSDQTAPKAVKLPHVIDEAHPEIWYFSAVTTKCTCAWTATVHWTAGDRHGTMKIDDNGKPYIVSATNRSIRIDNDFGSLKTWRIVPKGVH